jgi:hypothetical protein
VAPVAVCLNAELEVDEGEIDPFQPAVGYASRYAKGNRRSAKA